MFARLEQPAIGETRPYSEEPYDQQLQNHPSLIQPPLLRCAPVVWQSHRMSHWPTLLCLSSSTLAAIPLLGPLCMLPSPLHNMPIALHIPCVLMTPVDPLLLTF